MHLDFSLQSGLYYPVTFLRSTPRSRHLQPGDLVFTTIFLHAHSVVGIEQYGSRLSALACCQTRDRRSDLVRPSHPPLCDCVVVYIQKHVSLVGLPGMLKMLHFISRYSRRPFVYSTAWFASRPFPALLLSLFRDWMSWDIPNAGLRLVSLPASSGSVDREQHRRIMLKFCKSACLALIVPPSHTNSAICTLHSST